jgi:hypothetical protein
LIAGLAANRHHDPDAGYSLAQWAQITSRLDRLSAPPNTSLNLDGGGSVALVVMQPGGERISVAQQPAGRPVANLIGFVERRSGGDGSADSQGKSAHESRRHSCVVC